MFLKKNQKIITTIDIYY